MPQHTSMAKVKEDEMASLDSDTEAPPHTRIAGGPLWWRLSAPEVQRISREFDGVLIIVGETTYAVRSGLARQCAFLKDLLDELDNRAAQKMLSELEVADAQPDTAPSEASPVTLHLDATPPVLDAILYYLELVLMRRPSSIGQPLVKPLRLTVSKWEWEYLCGLLATPQPPDTKAQTNRDAANSGTKVGTSPLHGDSSCAVNWPLLVNVMRVADFLGVSSLCDLTCARFAELIANEKTPAALERLISGANAKPLCEDDFAAVHKQYPFIKLTQDSQNNAGKSDAAREPSSLRMPIV